MSNFYPCELNIYGVKHKSAKHAFQIYESNLLTGDLDAASKQLWKTLSQLCGLENNQSERALERH